MKLGKSFLGRRHVLESVPSTLTELQVEATFPSGTFLVTVHDPICTEAPSLHLALYGSFLPIPNENTFLPIVKSEEPSRNKSGACVILKQGRIPLNKGRNRIRVAVISRGDRPIQVGW